MHVLALDHLFLGLLLGLLAGAGIELAILWFAGRRWIPNRSAEVYNAKAAAGDLDDARDHFIEPIRQEITLLKAELTSAEAPDVAQELEVLFGDFEARFTTAYQADIQTLQTDIMTEVDRIPRRVTGMIRGPEGAEEAAFRAMVIDAEADVEGEISVMEAVAQQDPRAMQVAIAQKIQKLGNDPEWQAEHQIGSLILEMGKPTLMNWVQTMAAQMKSPSTGQIAGPKEKKFSSPYG